MQFLKKTDIPFMDIRKIGFGVSGVLLLISLISLVIQGGPLLGIDFRGGTFFELGFENKNDSNTPGDIPINQVRNIFSKYGLENSELKYYGSKQDIYAQVNVEIDTVLVGNVKNALAIQFPDYNVIERGRGTVSPKIGQELIWQAVRAILISLSLILLYIMFRFEFKFGVGAVAALFHDVLITLGIFSVLRIEISIAIVAALLTIVGYSLNDTIVVFDRIRENLKTLKRKASNYSATVNRSINETLSRTLVTSGTTLLVVVILFFFGGEILKDFAFALICGVIVGTYSSIFIASPVLIEWEIHKSGTSTAKKNK